MNPGHELLQLGELRRRGSGAGVDANVRRAIVEALPAEHAGIDRGSAAGERQEGHGSVRLLDGERERGTNLIAVQRTMAGGAHPARAVMRPVLGRGVARRSVLAGPVAGKAGAARPVILAAAEAPETEAAFELDRLIGIAFAGRNGIAEAGDEQVAHRDLGDDPLRGAVAERNVDGSDGRMAVTHPQSDFSIAGRADLPKRSAAVVEAPGAGLALRHRTGNRDANRMIPGG